MPARCAPIALIDGDRWVVIRNRQPHPALWEGEIGSGISCLSLPCTRYSQDRMSDPDRQVPGSHRSALLPAAPPPAAGAAGALVRTLWVAVWPPLGIAGVFLCLALLDLPAMLPPSLHLALLVAMGLAFVALLVRGFARIDGPRRAGR